MKEQRIAQPAPIPRDAKIVKSNFPIIYIDMSPALISESGFEKSTAISPTTLKRMMATASLTMPYPKMIEKSFGCIDELMSVRAATESVAEMVALYLMMRLMSMY